MEGIIAIWKERGMTSHDVVFKLRKLLGIKKIGHGGTLDPDVDGVLPVCVGEATKLVDYLLESAKTYQGQVTIGFSTDTEDAGGQVLDQVRMEAGQLDEDMVDQAIKNFQGDILQTPPMYSAVKVKGKKLYEYARQGIQVERPSRQVTIYDFRRLSPLIFEDGLYKFKVEVKASKGTYIRTLLVDLGKALGYPAHMSQLTRIEAGGFKEDQTFTLEEVATALEEGRLEEVFHPMEEAVKDRPSFDLAPDLWEKVKDGAVFYKEEFPHEIDQESFFYYQGRLVAIYQPHPSKKHLIKPKKILNRS